MSKNLLDEDLFVLREGPSKVKKSYSSLYGYITNGRASISGKMVYLESCLLESGIATSVEAWKRFRRRLNDGKDARKNLSLVRLCNSKKETV